MTMIKAKAKSAKRRRARELQERIQRSSDRIEKTTLVITRCKTMPDIGVSKADCGTLPHRGVRQAAPSRTDRVA